jgi:hypothetical protein
MHTRGEIVADFLSSSDSPEAFLRRLHEGPSQYAGYNVICGDAATGEVTHYSNRANVTPTPLRAGLHAMSNGPMSDVWPKMARGKALLQPLLEDLSLRGMLCCYYCWIAQSFGLYSLFRRFESACKICCLSICTFPQYRPPVNLESPVRVVMMASHGTGAT